MGFGGLNPNLRWPHFCNVNDTHNPVKTLSTLHLLIYKFIPRKTLQSSLSCDCLLGVRQHLFNCLVLEDATRRDTAKRIIPGQNSPNPQGYFGSNSH